MKKLLIISLIGLGICNFSCSDMLNVEPENSVTFTNFYKTEQDMEAVVNAAHGFLVKVLRGVTIFDYASVQADASPVGMTTPLGASRFHGWDFPQCNTSWSNFYATIYQSNLLFDNVKKQICAKNRMDFYFGQAYFIKSVCYFELGRQWGDAVITGSTEDPSMRGKSPAAVVLDTALFFAKRAFELLPAYEQLRDRAGQPITSKQYGCKGNVATLIANIYLWKAAIDKGLTEDQRIEYYTEADKWATKLLDTDECGIYRLEKTIADLESGTLNNRGGKESIFEIELNPNDGTLDGAVFYTARWFVGFPIVPGELPGDMNKKQWKIKNETIRKMYPGNDERREEFFYKPDLYATHKDSAKICKGWAFTYKFRKPLYGTGAGAGQTISFADFDVNKIYWRLADLILLRAEARFHIGNIEGAKADLWRIQDRAKAARYVSGDLQKAIFKEREKEFIFENNHWFSVVRNEGYYKTELPFQEERMPFPPFLTKRTYPYADITADEIVAGAFYLPVGPGAFNLNPMMVQNTYWFNKN